MCNVCTMFIFNSEQSPHASPSNLGKGNEEGDHSTMLDVMGIDRVKYPIESKYRIKYHGCVIPVLVFEATNITEVLSRGVGLKK